eukprot:TRINITY_DN28736_c0_g1_i1.p1 TRINITY_DN28736_c0_g1~~TRINITY_DN28736_c0_g1_i1.p1  ORF type:complete len:531 (-),score=107.36 TRINITY_DN28736_c0_g1_i1:73-1617(-)
MFAQITDTSHPLELAESWAKVIEKYFKDWDADGGGTIDKEELGIILQNVMLTVEEKDIDDLFAVIAEGEDEIDFDQFKAWITNRQAESTVALDGFIESFSFYDSVKPLFQVFDKNHDGGISVHEMETFSLLIRNALKLHPLATRDYMVCEWDASDWPFSGEASFEEFADWQAEVLENSGVPNNQLPKLFWELSESLNRIFQIEHDEKVKKDNPHSEAELKVCIKRVSDTARFLYTQSKETMVIVAEKAPPPPPSKWVSPPSCRDLYVLSKACIDAGICLDAFKERIDADGNEPPKRPERRASTSGRPASKARTGREEPLACGTLVLCIPDMNKGERKVGTVWLAKVQKTVIGPGGAVEEEVMFRWSTTTLKWARYFDKSRWDLSLSCLPPPLRLLAMLKAKSPADDKLDWQTANDTIEEAIEMELMIPPALETWQEKVRELVEEAILSPLDDAQLDELQASGDFEDVVQDYLENQFVMTPLEALNAINEWKMMLIDQETLDDLAETYKQEKYYQ